MILTYDYEFNQINDNYMKVLDGLFILSVLILLIAYVYVSITI